MVIWTRSVALGAACVALAAGCVSDGAEPPNSDEPAAAPDISVTVPPERLTPFCTAMIDLSDRLRTGDVDGAETVDLIIETYRSIENEAPAEISADFSAVLAALVTGAPTPTDPPLPTTPTTPRPPSVTGTSPTTSLPSPPPPTPSSPASGSTGTPAPTPTSSPGVDVGYAAGTSPSERINNYVTFACRDTQNNPGPPATEPLEEPQPTTP